MSKLLAKIKSLVKTSAEWTASNKILLEEQRGIESDTKLVKIGDGTTAWNDLPYQKVKAEDVIGLISGEGAELIVNKSTSIITDQASDVKYPSVKAVYDYADGLVSSIANAIVIKGTWDPSVVGAQFPNGASNGWAYIVSADGTVDGVDFVAEDLISAITTNPSTTTYAGNWYKFDHTDKVWSVNSRTGVVTGLEETNNKNAANGYPGLSATKQLLLGDATNPIGLNHDIILSKDAALADLSLITASNTAGSSLFRSYKAGGTLSAPTTVPAYSTLAGLIGFGYGAASFTTGGELFLTVDNTPSGDSFNTGWKISIRQGTSTFYICGINGDGIGIPSGKKFFFDGYTNIGDSYCYESSANVVDFYAGATKNLSLTSNGAYIKNRVVSYTGNVAAPNIDIDITDQFVITGQTIAITGITWSGTPYSKQPLIIHITSTNTGIVFNTTYFEGSGTHSLIQSLTSGIEKSFAFTYNSITGKYTLKGVS